ncbi:MAG: hypothetical protein HC908_18005 [Calothrix sp. SM1_7_51]|nr:hypothetical protein [Calothrix sp. SM1_7_51]
MKEKYGDDFKSLAVVVKTTDVKAFKGVSDNCICAKTSPREAAIEIIKFIDNSMGDSRQVKRLFLDDYLTMEKIFSGISSIQINPDTYRVYPDRKAAIAEEDIDAQPLTKLLNTRLNEAWLVGREFNLALYVSSHSSNVEGLPFIGSREARAVGDLIFLAKSDKREFIEQALINPNLIADANKRNELKALLNAQNLNSTEPLILSNFNNGTLGIVPDSVYEEYQNYRSIWTNKASKDVAALEKIFNLEASNIHEQITKIVDNHVADSSEDNAVNLSETAQIILEILQASTKESLNFHAIRNSRKWGDNKPVTDDIKAAIKELTREVLIEGTGNGEFKIT